jgi:hypothetical protein
MVNYLASFTNTNLVGFPDTEAVNATGPSATDGTEFVKLMIDDHWGARQAIMAHAGLTPDGVTEAAGTAQIIEALQKGFGGSPGFVQEWNLAADPGTTGHRCLLLQGQGILRANYPDVDAAVYVGDGNNAAVAAAGGAYYHADDAAGTIPNTIGLYLILPEGRGVVPRGLDTAAAIDPDGASRYLGDLQVDAFQGHHHELYSGFSANGNLSGASDLLVLDSTIAARVNTIDGSDITRESVTDGVNGTPRTSSETRMYNRSTKYVIWY